MSGAVDPYADLRRLAPEATPGPWRWWGHDGRTIALTTRGYGIAAVMAFARLGMQEAQPVFYKRSTKPKGGYIDGGKFRKAMSIVVRERDYRTDIAKLDHPDAEWIAAADPTTVSALLAERDALAEILRQLLLLGTIEIVPYFGSTTDGWPADPGGYVRGDEGCATDITADEVELLRRIEGER